MANSSIPERKARAPDEAQVRKVFGLRLMREGQREVIARVLEGDSMLAVMPTGAGKSRGRFRTDRPDHARAARREGFSCLAANRAHRAAGR
ncbi:hypothetical protein [Variovorax saccharolyticus]|uniref:hypothetical protein n=1 Tax=Variovorax saccharolyticus TaxID=3053516 RepID=UPI0025783E3D|nr:hypothetical protein [Variovorax sp. J22R187]MDM0021976.1 hypothetical protein [Variovorax sp. J22R187]